MAAAPAEQDVPGASEGGAAVGGVAALFAFRLDSCAVRAGVVNAVLAVFASTLAAVPVDAFCLWRGVEVPVPAWIHFIRDPAAGAWSIARFVFLAVVVSPALEECLFRRVIQCWLVRFFGVPLAVATTAVAFAALHLDPFSFVPLLAVSTLFSRAFLRGGLAASMLAHMLFNIAAILEAWLLA